MRNLFVVLFFGILLAGGGNLFGQDSVTTQTHPTEFCTCNDIHSLTPNIDFWRDPPYTSSSCFGLFIGVDFDYPNCSNFVSIDLDLKNFPRCLLETSFNMEKRIDGVWKPFLDNVIIPSSKHLILPLNNTGFPNNILGTEYRFCPNGTNQDCANPEYRFPINTKITLMDNNGLPIECETQETWIDYSAYLTQILENSNYSFEFSPQPVKDKLVISTVISTDKLDNFV
jgi:hypothetical protein